MDSDEDHSTPRHVPLEPLDPLSLDEALALIGEPTRAAIISHLGEARQDDETRRTGLSFSELLERTGIDDSGRFNYHLERLVDTFVKRTDTSYRLRLPGRLLYQAMVAGTFTDRKTIEPFRIGPCPACDGDLTAAYHPDHLLTVECTACATLYDAMHLPARGLEDRDTDALLDAAYQRRHHVVATMRRGVCPGCGGVVDRELTTTTTIDTGNAGVEELAGLELYAVLTCRACHTRRAGHPTNIALTTPTVVGFFADHGLDAARARWWTEPVATARDQIELVHDEPPMVAIPFAIDGDRLQIVLDANLQVAEAARTDA